jgi:Cu/Ag efflux pump CusA
MPRKLAGCPAPRTAGRQGASLKQMTGPLRNALSAWTSFLTGSPFNLMAQIGLLILIGIVVNNGMVLLYHVHHLRQLVQRVWRGGTHTS